MEACRCRRTDIRLYEDACVYLCTYEAVHVYEDLSLELDVCTYEYLWMSLYG